MTFYTKDPKDPTKTIKNEFSKIAGYEADVKNNKRKQVGFLLFTKLFEKEIRKQILFIKTVK